MGRKTITVSDEVYSRLERKRAEDETFSDVIEQLLAEGSTDHPLRELEGLLDDEEAEEVRARVAEFRREPDEEFRDDW